MSKYRTGIIACGIIARVHARGWQGVKGRPTAIGAIADTNPDALREFGDFFEVGEEYRYADYRQMLDRENLDFVDVCSWHQQHAEMVIAAAARQPKAIICQKPMAIDLGEADDMLTACVRNGVKLMIAYQRPHHATWLKARELIRQGTVGRVSQIQLDAGGNLLNTNSHNIRLALFLMDEPRVEWVMGALERTTDLLERGLPAEDAMLGIAACDNGATILIQGNLIEGLGQGCRVIGSRGIMELDTSYHAAEVIPSDAPMRMPEGLSARYNYEIGRARYLNGASNGWNEVSEPWHDCWSRQCQEAIDWVEGQVEAPISGAAQGRAVQEVMMALFESARKEAAHLPPAEDSLEPSAADGGERGAAGGVAGPLRTPGHACARRGDVVA